MIFRASADRLDREIAHKILHRLLEQHRRVRHRPLGSSVVHRLWLGRRYSSCVSGSIGHVDDRFGFSTLLVDDVHGFFVLRFAHFYCNPFHADTGGTDADNQKKPRRRTTPGKRIMTIGLRKDRLKNEPTTGNINWNIMFQLIFRTAVGLANDMEGIISSVKDPWRKGNGSWAWRYGRCTRGSRWRGW